LRTVGGPELVANGGHVVLDRLRTNEQPFGDLRVRRAHGKQLHDFQLSPGQSWWLAPRAVGVAHLREIGHISPIVARQRASMGLGGSLQCETAPSTDPGPELAIRRPIRVRTQILRTA
jgi:hypothetical protein